MSYMLSGHEYATEPIYGKREMYLMSAYMLPMQTGSVCLITPWCAMSNPMMPTYVTECGLRMIKSNRPPDPVEFKLWMNLDVRCVDCWLNIRKRIKVG